MTKKKNINKQDISGKGKQAVEEKNTQSGKKYLHSPIVRILPKFLLVIFLFLILIIISDTLGIFNASQQNDHTLRKWNSFYGFTEKYNVDVLLIGNSHLYTGVNPKNLSNTLGTNAFILAAPGTQIADSYFSLKEALKRCKPGLVVIETYGIKEFDQHKLNKNALSDQLKSFSARKDFLTKLESTPALFSSKHYIHAWSNTLRNHNFIFTNREQLKENWSIIKEGNDADKQDFYLGRYVRFVTGIEDTTLIRYETDGPPVDGNKYQYNHYTEKYVDKIVELCDSEGISYLFLTLPMYEKHIRDYRVWKSRIAEILDRYDGKWLDMQYPYREDIFTPICFENTLKQNQHMTYQGSLAATYMLANFIKEEVKPLLPDRSGEAQWHNLFYDSEGYFENYPPHPNDPRFKILARDMELNDFRILEVSSKTDEANQATTITVKIERKPGISYNRSRLNLGISYTENGESRVTDIPFPYDWMHTPLEHAIYSQTIRATGLDLTGVTKAELKLQDPA